jgi:DNA-binding MarR family transcriptional regulator
VTEPEPRWLDDTEMRAWTGFLETASLVQRRNEAQLRVAGRVTSVQYDVLHCLSEAPDRRLRMSDLADRLITSRSGLTYQIAQLEAAGLVERRAGTDDQRSVLAILTDAGSEVLSVTAPGHVRLVRDAFLDALTRRQIEQLAAIMDRTRRHLRSLDAPR